MHIQSATLRNFRMHLDTTITFENTTTLIVGRNNAGKTAVAELFRRFFGDSSVRTKSTFTLDDLSIARHDALIRAARSSFEDDQGRIEPPAIELALTISYADSLGDLAAISDFIVDLDDDCAEAKILLRYARSTGLKGESFYDLLPEEDVEALDTLDKRFQQTYEVVVEAIDPTDETNRTEQSLNTLLERLQLGFIDAARPMEGDRNRDPDTLGRTLSALFDASRKAQNAEAAAAIEKGVADAERMINELFRDEMKGKILPSFVPLGYPLLSDGELATRTTFDTIQLLRQHTKLYYSALEGLGAGRPLPEGHNGLGLRNLIYILLQLHAFHETRKAAASPPPVCMLFLEEPEAHLHPQLEEIFIRKVMEVHAILCGDKQWPLQIVVTTHASHIANEVPFDQIRYFLRVPSPCKKQWMSAVKDLGDFGADVITKAWLMQYLTLTRCDLFFADKAVLIEGAAERLLLPAFLHKLDKDDDGDPLTAQYLTVVEVDGRHAHKFYPLLDFIGVPALIITDIDAEALLPAKKGGVNKDGSARRTWQKCLVSEGERSGNPCIKSWFDCDSLTELMQKSDEEKSRSDETLMRIAFQIPEDSGAPCGRSFEEALILANPKRWPIPEEVEDDHLRVEAWATEMAEEKGKTSLALDLIEAVCRDDFVIPKYIRDGLCWLRKAGSSRAAFVNDQRQDAVSEPASDCHFGGDDD